MSLKKPSTKSWAFSIIVSSLALSLLACGNDSPTLETKAAKVVAPSDSVLNVGFIAFGDSGYHTDYLKEKQYKPQIPDRQAFINGELEEWLEDGGDPAKFIPSPSVFIPSVESMVDASGMYPVASAMKSHCKKVDCQFSVMLGDNIYPDGATLGVDGKDDSTRFADIFTKPFGDMGQGNKDYRIYTALGNHDWNTSREGAMAQVDFMETNKPFYMDGLFYTVKPPAGKGEIEIFVIDTEVILAGTDVKDAKLNKDGSEVPTDELDEMNPWSKPQNPEEKNMVAWLDDKLKNSTAKWKFVIAHHPIWSSGGSKFEQARVLRKLLLPSMCRYADMYFVGHEHSLELHEDSCASVSDENQQYRPLLQVLSGAAAKQRPVNFNFKAFQDKTYPENNAIFVKGMIWGFSHIQLEGDKATISMFSTPNNETGEVVEEFSYEYQRRSHIATVN
ncbi:metallophosphoesterase [Aliiglaciecola lipolytica]|nr:metallophosphoesterase [Aliiglaciecola lipolytica]